MWEIYFLAFKEEGTNRHEEYENVTLGEKGFFESKHYERKKQEFKSEKNSAGTWKNGFDEEES